MSRDPLRCKASRVSFWLASSVPCQHIVSTEVEHNRAMAKVVSRWLRETSAPANSVVSRVGCSVEQMALLTISLPLRNPG